jgi:hypothetical protein
MTRSADRARARALFGPGAAASAPPEAPAAAPAPAGPAGDTTPEPPADDRVLALLRDAVPPVPDAPDRLAAVRARAGHQRSTVWSQVIGAAAAVLLVAGVAAAVGAPRPGEIRPSSRPLAHLAEKLARQTSVSFELTTRRLTNEAGAPQGSAATSALRGAYARNGDLHVDGNLGILGMSVGERGDLSMRGVGGVTYRSVTPFDHAPAGKIWVRETDGATATTGAQIESLVSKATAIARNVHYVRPGVVRDTKVGEYVLTVPGRYVGGTDLNVAFALDADGLPRRLSADVSLRQLFAMTSAGSAGSDDGYDGADLAPDAGWSAFVLHVELDLFDYGRPVDVSPPPTSQVIDAEALREMQEKKIARAQQDYETCLRKAHDAAGFQACSLIMSRMIGFGASVPPTATSCTTVTQPDGTQQREVCGQGVHVSPAVPGSTSSGTGWAVATVQPAPPSPAP